jgi:hypothetical protein
LDNRVYLKLNESFEDKLPTLLNELDTLRGISLKDIEDIKKLKKAVEFMMLNEEHGENVVTYEIPIEICIEFQEALYLFGFGGSHLAQLLSSETQSDLRNIVMAMNESINRNQNIPQEYKEEYFESFGYVKLILERT